MKQKDPDLKVTIPDFAILAITILVVIFCALSTCSPVSAATISKADQIATVEHLRRLVKDSRSEVTVAKNEVTALQKEADKIAGERDWWQNESGKKDAAIKRYQGKLRLLGLLLALTAAISTFFALAQLSGYLTTAFTPYLLAGRLGLSVIVFMGVFSWVRYF